MLCLSVQLQLGKPNVGCLLAGCRETNDSVSSSVSIFLETVVPTLKEFSAEGVALTTSVLLCSEKQHKQKGFVFTAEIVPVGPQYITLMHGKMYR